MLKQNKKKFIIGIMIVIGIAFAWVLATQLTRYIQISDNFQAPFFMVW